MNMKLILAGAGAAALFAGAAMAQQGQGMGPGKGMGPGGMGKGDPAAMMEAHFAQMDANSDGLITHDEFIAYQMQRAEQRWARFSSHAGDDGAVSLEEAKAHHDEMMQARGKMKGKGMKGKGKNKGQCPNGGDCPYMPKPADDDADE